VPPGPMLPVAAKADVAVDCGGRLLDDGARIYQLQPAANVSFAYCTLNHYPIIISPERTGAVPGIATAHSYVRIEERCNVRSAYFSHLCLISGWRTSGRSPVILLRTLTMAMSNKSPR
jgi:hypothetical protein